MSNGLHDWAARYIGIPFRDRGRTREQGLDCWGLVRLVYEETFNVSLPSFTSCYEDVRRDIRAIRVSIARESPSLFRPVGEGVLGAEPMAVLLHERGLPLHVAMYAGRQAGRAYVLHTTKDRGHSHLERLDGPELANSEPRFFRHLTINP